MANPTTNYGWQMPTSTDLVTDLPADFEVFGQAVDTSLLGLKGGTTGQVLSKTSGTDMAFTWATDASGIPATIVDAKGDIIAATAADAVSRLAVGANNTILTADSTTATGLKWAAAGGGMTLVQRSTYSAVANTGTTFDGVFSATYQRYIIEIDKSLGSVNNKVNFNWRVGASTQSASSYRYYSAHLGASGGWGEINAGDALTTAQILSNGTSTIGAKSSTLNVYGAGNEINNPFLNGFLTNGGNAGVSWARYTGLDYAGIIATGFILTASTGTITGTVSIYGLAI